MTTADFISMYGRDLLLYGGVVLMLAIMWGGLVVILIAGFVHLVKTTLVHPKPNCPECEGVGHVVPAGGRMWRCKKCAVTFKDTNA